MIIVKNDNDKYIYSIYINRMIGNDKHKIQPVLVFRWTVLATNLPFLLLDMWCSDWSVGVGSRNMRLVLTQEIHGWSSFSHGNMFFLGILHPGSQCPSAQIMYQLYLLTTIHSAPLEPWNILLVVIILAYYTTWVDSDCELV